MSGYKRLIDADIEAYCHELLAVTGEQFGNFSRESLSAYTAILGRGGKRIRGTLTMHAYYTLGGEDADVALRAARAVEMLQAYVLIVDDVMDRSPTRRGGPTAHMMLKELHETRRLRDDSLHFGESIATNAALYGAHAALLEIGKLPVSADVRIRALNTLNTLLMATAHGEINDVYNQVAPDITEASVENVLIWKTAYYTFTNPLQFGAILAEADDATLDVLRDYSVHAGRAFQISDDILGVFAREDESGKSPLDDIREGKQTLLTTRALDAATTEEVVFLRRCLGNPDLTPQDLVRCQQIICDHGVLDAVRTEAAHSAAEAIAILRNSSLPTRLIQFLANLVQYVVERKS